ncbi:PaaX family transcriptional regulator [Rhodococcoides fascians]|uniref:PaaX family transcriptional regulator n=1 Tax=Rhodococcoides fascians TaxID=1828 RepID=UPI0006909CB2|nr:PaaX family transcriptional regulator C-terminal domain-containing protein [Rhodococcus fascians]
MVRTVTNATILTDDDAASVKPQSVLLTILGRFVLGRDIVVSTPSVLEVLGSVGVGEHAARSALNRMVKRDLLTREKYGRKAYIGLTERSEVILQDGHQRIWNSGATEVHWDGTWTLMSFTFPDSWQRQRHDLRAKLQWAGFGVLQGGLWISPGSRDVAPLLQGVEGGDRVRVFYSRAEDGMNVESMLRDAWDVESIAERYNGFLERWSRPLGADAAGELATQLILETEWLDVIRQDPRLPLQHLPTDWPATPAQKLFRSLHSELDPVARAEATARFDMLPARERQAATADLELI